MPFRRNRSRRRHRRTARLGLAVLLASLAVLALAAPAQAVESFAFEYGITGFGEGDLLCKVGTGKAAACKAEYSSGTKLTLVPVPAKGSEFVGYESAFGSAEACEAIKEPSKEPECKFTLVEESYVEAAFEPTQDNQLAIKLAGEGEILCESELGSECEPKPGFEYGLEITLVAEPAPGWEFTGFRNGKGSAKLETCVGLGPCTFEIEGNSSIEAVFGPRMYPLSIHMAGGGHGTVTCGGSPCAASYPEGEEVTLAATPAAGSTFAGWSGEECTGTGPCVVTIGEGPATVTATFEGGSPSPPPPPPPPAVGTAKAAATAKVKSGKAQVKVSCAGGPCSGILKLSARLTLGGKRKTVAIGQAGFSLADGTSKTLAIKLSAKAVRQLNASGSLRGSVGGTGVSAGALRLALAGRR